MERRERELELYFHVPFCLKKCNYCDFLSFGADSPLGDGRTKARYVENLIRETRARAEDCREYRVVSVFVGGGTPSTVAPEQLSELMAAVRENYCLAQDAEVTVEVNPGTVEEGALQSYVRAGVNRLSIGLQSADDRELAALGRVHTFGQFLEAYEAARRCGFSNVNVDVMSALPGQTLEGYLETLDKVLALEPQPEHVSAYSLILEEGTPLAEQARRGELALPDEETDRLMYGSTQKVLERAGYVRYEISNYAKPGFQCRHNCGYWRRREYAGFGVGAASLMKETRYKNSADLRAYLEDPLGCREDVHALTLLEQMEEFMFLGLRLTEGISVSGFEAAFGRPLREVYEKAVEENLRDGLLAYRDGGSRLALTERGLDLANHAMARFLL